MPISLNSAKISQTVLHFGGAVCVLLALYFFFGPWGFLGLFLTLFIFTFIVFFHELGHFLVAKMSGVQVEEFGIGIPPKAKTLFTDKKGTAYTLNWLPLGGFVKLAGEEGKDDRKGSFSRASFLQKLAILLAGVTMNFLFAWILLAGIFYSGVKPLTINTLFPNSPETRLFPSFEYARNQGVLTSGTGFRIEPLPESIALKAGVSSGTLVSINSRELKEIDDISKIIQDTKPGQSITLRVFPEGKDVYKDISLIPESGKIGISVGYHDIKVNEYQVSSVSQAIWYGLQETYYQSKMTYHLLADLVRKMISPNLPQERTQAIESLSGPIAVGDIFTKLLQAQAPVIIFIILAAMISINLGAFNLLPLPALDGGRALLVIVRACLSPFGGKQFLDNLEQKLHFVFFLLLLVLGILIAIKDILKILS